MKKRIFLHYFLGVFLTLLIISCSGGLHFSQSSHSANEKVKTEALALISKSTDSFSLHAAEVDSLKAQIDRIVLEEKTRKGNQATNLMWEAVQKDQDNLYAFFELWKKQGTVSPAAASEIKRQMNSILNIIDKWEQSKKDGPLAVK